MRINILNEAPITAAEVKEELKKIKKEHKELNFRAQKTEDYLNQAFPDSKKSSDIVKKLEGMKIPRLREEHIVKLADVKPTTEQDVKVALQGYAVTVTKENMNKIAKAISEFV